MQDEFLRTIRRLVRPPFHLVLAFAGVLAVTPAYGQDEALVSVDDVVEQAFTQTVPIIGRLVTRQAGTVACRISGAVTDILADVGDRVTTGQVLARVDVASLTLRKELAEAQVTEANARLKTARAQLVLAGQEVKRLSGLQDSAAVSKAAYDDAVQQENIAFSRVREAEAAISSATASVRLTELDLSYAEIRAPYDGVVTERLTEVGSYLQPGQSVVRLISDRELELEADIPYDRLGGVIPGTRVDVVLDNGSRHTATVRAVVPEENPRTRTRRVRFEPDIRPRAGSLASQQSATVMIPAGEQRDIVTVHKDAVTRRGADNIVYVVKEDLAQIRLIQTGESVGDRLEVLEGLAPGERTVVRGNERLRPGQKVFVAAPE